MSDQESNRELKTRIHQLERRLDKRTSQLTEEISEFINLQTDLDNVKTQHQQQYFEQQEMLNAVMENIPVAVMLMDRHGMVWFVNKETEKILGKSAEQLCHKTIMEIFPVEGEITYKYLKKIFNEKKGINTEQKFSIDGVGRCFDMIGHPIHDNGGNVSFVLVIGLEITRRKRLEKLMVFQNTIDSLQSITDTFIGSMDLLFDNLFSLEWVDAGGLYIFDDMQETLTLKYHRGLPEKFISKTRRFDRESQHVKKVMEGKPWFITPDQSLNSTADNIKEEGITFLSVVPLVYKGKVIGCLNLASKTVSGLDNFQMLTIESISGRLANLVMLTQTQQEIKTKNEELTQTLHRLQVKRQMLIQKGRLESLGELLAGMAHEINQPLSVISLALGNMETSLNEGEKDPGYYRNKINAVMRNIGKIRELIDHVRIFSRDQGEMKFEQVDINRTIKNALSLINEQLQRHDIEVETNLDESIGYCIGNASRLEQVFLNLTSNSRDALNEKEKRGNIRNGKKLLRITSKKDKKNAVINVYDNGTGIDPEIIDKIFDPFFTTKGSGMGTGLGLPIVYGIISEMKGEISARSVKGDFTELEIILPAPIKMIR